MIKINTNSLKDTQICFVVNLNSILLLSPYKIRLLFALNKFRHVSQHMVCISEMRTRDLGISRSMPISYTTLNLTNFKEFIHILSKENHSYKQAH